MVVVASCSFVSFSLDYKKTNEYYTNNIAQYMCIFSNNNLFFHSDWLEGRIRKKWEISVELNMKSNFCECHEIGWRGEEKSESYRIFFCKSSTLWSFTMLVPRLSSWQNCCLQGKFCFFLLYSTIWVNICGRLSQNIFTQYKTWSNLYASLQIAQQQI